MPLSQNFELFQFCTAISFLEKVLGFWSENDVITIEIAWLHSNASLITHVALVNFLIKLRIS